MPVTPRIISFSAAVEAQRSVPEAQRLLSGEPQLTVWNHYTEETGQFFAGVWAATRGRWVVRTAMIDRAGRPAVSTIARAGRDALLADLAPGPDDDALVLWSEPQQGAVGRPDLDRNAIFAARGIDGSSGRPVFARPELIAPPGPNSDATVALDPDSDRALAVWRGAGGALEYALRDVSPGR